MSFPISAALLDAIVLSLSLIHISEPPSLLRI